MSIFIECCWSWHWLWTSKCVSHLYPQHIVMFFKLMAGKYANRSITIQMVMYTCLYTCATTCTTRMRNIQIMMSSWCMVNETDLSCNWILSSVVGKFLMIIVYFKSWADIPSVEFCTNTNTMCPTTVIPWVKRVSCGGCMSRLSGCMTNIFNGFSYIIYRVVFCACSKRLRRCLNTCTRWWLFPNFCTIINTINTGMFPCQIEITSAIGYISDFRLYAITFKITFLRTSNFALSIPFFPS